MIDVDEGIRTAAFQAFRDAYISACSEADRLQFADAIAAEAENEARIYCEERWPSPEPSPDTDAAHALS